LTLVHMTPPTKLATVEILTYKKAWSLDLSWSLCTGPSNGNGQALWFAGCTIERGQVDITGSQSDLRAVPLRELSFVAGPMVPVS
jgi:hypothetical protein